MVVLNKIYTKTGDAGETALGNGTRVAKHSVRVNAYGTVDELNSTVGIARLVAEGDVDEMLSRIQNDLFDLGADLCRPDIHLDDEAGYPVLRMVPEQTKRLEAEIDKMISRLEPLRSFILPAGTPLATHLHVCRTV
ncbi:MAG: cob(I)yrinic acid a,c-diamide adenosyltransferase, partial [Silicimonas sp.]|nr:cob(I)yrinic acid a,c-diamide adenosyltransferase [Silicimonas sp.]